MDIQDVLIILMKNNNLTYSEMNNLRGTSVYIYTCVYAYVCIYINLHIYIYKCIYIYQYE